LRAASWRTLVSGRLDGRRLVFVDECSTNTTSLSPIYGWSRRGSRVRFEAPRNWGANVVTLLWSMSFEGMGPSLAVEEGATTKAVFEAYAERVLVPSLCAGQKIVVMDNLSAHKGEKVRELIARAGVANSSTCRPIRRTSTP
jgi:hypothetical protein